MFGNFQSHRLESSHGQRTHQENALGHTFGPRSGSNTVSGRQVQPVRESFESFTGKNKSDLTILTAEGDRITISFAAQVKYAASSQADASGSSQTESTSTSSQLRVAVDGNLNESELKDVGTLLNILARATSQAGGQATSSQSNASQPAPAVPDLSSSADFTGLASLAAFAYNYKQTVEAGTLVYSRG